MDPLRKRVLAALAAIPLVVALTFWRLELPFKLMAAGVLFLGLLEFYRMAEAHGLPSLRRPGAALLVLILLPFFLGPDSFFQGKEFLNLIPDFARRELGTPFALFLQRECLVAGLLFLSLTFLFSRRPLGEMVVSASVTFFGAVYFGLLGGYFFALRQMDHGAWHLLWFCAATWAYDTGGYFVGKKWGRHPMTPEASPKKTWEGAGGGFLFCLAALLVLWKAFPFYSGFYALADVLALSALFSLFGQLGDLAESLMKRSLSAKDSGDFLPGHGGVFDRLDSLLFNAPVLFYYLMMIK